MEDLLSLAHVHGNIYGTSISSVKQVAKTGKVCILEIDVQGAEKICVSKQLNPHFFFIHPPSHDVLEQRLKDRGTETEESLKIRVKNAMTEMEYAKSNSFFTHHIVNDQLQTCYQTLREELLTCYPHVREYAQQHQANI